ncbi:MAG: PAS domain S-box protein, partial [Proteobacteria bacterium]|nr:PAS domain S-box protein [Pseudomonadota bacterium]
TALFVVIFILLTAAVTAYGYRQRQANLYQDLYQTERERRQAQEEFQTILYSIGDAVITTDTAGLVKQVNSVAERLTGWLEAEARGKPLEEVFRIINEETRTAVENPAQRVLREGIVLGLANHTMLIARDGTEHPIADSGAPIRDENGAVIGVVLVFRDQTTERAAHKALRESEEHYRTLFDNMLNGFAYCKMLFEQNLPQDFIYLKVNQSFGELTGLKNVVGKKVSEVISGIRESDPELFEIYGRVALTGKPERFETYLEALKMWLSISVYSPEKEYFVAIFDVITERKRADEALKRLNYQHQLILSSAAEGILGLDLEGNHVFVNPAAAKMLGYEAEELIGSTSHATWHHTRLNGSPCLEEGCPIYEALKKATLSFGFDEVFWRKDGTSFPVDYATAPMIEDGKVSGSVLTFWDISQRREAEEAFRSLVSHAPMGIFIIQDGKFMMINPGFETITGYRKEELLGHEFECLAMPSYKEEVRSKAIMRLKGESPTPFEFQFITKSGETRWGIETITPTYFEGERATLGYFMDITEHKQLEEQFLQTEKMEAVGTLAGGIAHDFNNILTAILGNIGLAALDDKIGTRVKKRLAQAEAACLRAQALSQQLLTFAKGGGPVIKLFSVAELLPESTAFACVGSPVRCETTFPENLWWIEADPGQIDQVLQNLTINAIQAMPTGGTIKVWAENLTLGTDSNLPLSAGRYIKISVR